MSGRNRKQRAIKVTDEHDRNTSEGKWDIFCLSARGKKKKEKRWLILLREHGDSSGHITCTHARIRIKLPARRDTASIRGC